MENFKKRRHIRFHGKMEPTAVDNLILTINSIPKEDLIDIDFSSEGGEIPSAIKLSEVIWKHRKRIRMNNTGCVASAAILPYLAADERLVSPGATFFYHPIRTGLIGIPTTSEKRPIMWFSKASLEAGVQRIARDEKLYVDLHDRRTKVPRGKVRSLLQDDHTLDEQWGRHLPGSSADRGLFGSGGGLRLRRYCRPTLTIDLFISEPQFQGFPVAASNKFLRYRDPRRRVESTRHSIGGAVLPNRFFLLAFVH